MIKIDKDSIFYGVLLAIVVLILSNFLYKPNNETYDKLYTLMSDTVSGLRNPDDISKRTTGSGLMYLEYIYIDSEDTAYNLINTIESRDDWQKIEPLEEQKTGFSSKYCRTGYVLYVSVYKKDLKVVIEEDLYGLCENL